MDSISLVKETFGHYGEKCKIQVTSDSIYEGVYIGFAESTKENPLVLRLQISEKEANRIGAYGMRIIGIDYRVINNVEFFD